MKPIIAIVGAYGATGREVMSAIASREVDLHAVGRREDALAKLKSEFDRSISTAQADIDDAPALQRALANAAVVINCVGPMARVRDKVALATIEVGAHYVDPGGTSTLHDLLLPRADEMKAAGLCSVISSGWISGISEILPKYLMNVCEKDWGALDRLDVVYGDNNVWSETATLDVINHLRESDPVENLGHLQHGQVKRENILTMWGRPEMPDPIGKRIALRRLSREFVASFQNSTVPSISSSLSLVSIPTLLLFLRLRKSKSDQNSANIEAVNTARQRDQNRFGVPSFVFAKAHGMQEGKSVSRTALALAPDHYKATGCSAAASALSLLGARAQPKGLFYAGQFANPAIFLPIYRSMGNNLYVGEDPINSLVF